MIVPPTPSGASLALLLLCSKVAAPQAGPSPLSPLEWRHLRGKLEHVGNTDLAALPGSNLEILCRELKYPSGFAERLRILFGRREAALAELAEFQAQGIWVLTSLDPAFPTESLEPLGSRMPQVLFGVGDCARLRSKGISIVGSRDVDPAGAAYAAQLGQLCAEAGQTVISGGARGVDLQAMEGALKVGGEVIGVLADRLETAATRRTPEHAERLTQLACVHPRLGFSRSVAMQRNRVIHALGRATVTVASAEYGGTWNGSLENLAGGWSPLFVRSGADVPSGNRELLRRGAHPLPEQLPATAVELMQLLSAAG